MLANVVFCAAAALFVLQCCSVPKKESSNVFVLEVTSDEDSAALARDVFNQLSSGTYCLGEDNKIIVWHGQTPKELRCFQFGRNGNYKVKAKLTSGGTLRLKILASKSHVPIFNTEALLLDGKHQREDAIENIARMSLKFAI